MEHLFLELANAALNNDEIIIDINNGVLKQRLVGSVVDCAENDNEIIVFFGEESNEIRISKKAEVACDEEFLSHSNEYSLNIEGTELFISFIPNEIIC